MASLDELRQITEALNRIDDFSVLGQQRLANTQIVREAVQRAGVEDTAFQRGRILSHILRREIASEFERCQRQKRGRDVAEWTILYLRVHEARSLEEIAAVLDMPTRSVGRYYRRGKQLLLDRYFTQQEPAATGFYCARCGIELAKAVPGRGEIVVCSRCGATIESVDGGGGESVHLILTPARRNRTYTEAQESL